MGIHLKPRTLRTFQSRLLAWFREQRRDLPWRASRDPYRVWLAEIMLQQTRIAAVIPYYERFLRRFRDGEPLARARQAEVLKLWAGLGYYSRARNLHAAAKEIVARHGGKFPRDLDAALRLPGIGQLHRGGRAEHCVRRCRSRCSMETWRACSRGSARFAAICERRGRGERFRRRRASYSRARTPAIGIRR